MSSNKKVAYLSFDIETDGPDPIHNNMISIGIYGIDDELNNIFSYQANIEELEGHVPDQKCMNTFWLKSAQQEAYEFLQTDKRNYMDVCVDLSDKFNELNKEYEIKFVAGPACFDWQFFHCYYQMAKKHVNVNISDTMYDIGYKCHCSSAIWDLYVKKNKLTNKEAQSVWNRMGEVNPKKVHFALEDAKCQALVYIKTKHALLKDDPIRSFSHSTKCEYTWSNSKTPSWLNVFLAVSTFYVIYKIYKL
jgi:hypothetical protein